MEPRRIDLFMQLEELDCPIEWDIQQDFVINVQQLIVRRQTHWKLIDQPVAKMFHICAAASVHEHIILVAGEPHIEAINQAV